jgi:hypothetical protein
MKGPWPTGGGGGEEGCRTKNKTKKINDKFFIETIYYANRTIFIKYLALV